MKVTPILFYNLQNLGEWLANGHKIYRDPNSIRLFPFSRPFLLSFLLSNYFKSQSWRRFQNFQSSKVIKSWRDSVTPAFFSSVLARHNGFFYLVLVSQEGRQLDYFLLVWRTWSRCLRGSDTHRQIGKQIFYGWFVLWVRGRVACQIRLTRG